MMHMVIRGRGKVCVRNQSRVEEAALYLTATLAFNIMQINQHEFIRTGWCGQQEDKFESSCLLSTQYRFTKSMSEIYMRRWSSEIWVWVMPYLWLTPGSQCYLILLLLLYSCHSRYSSTFHIDNSCYEICRSDIWSGLHQPTEAMDSNSLTCPGPPCRADSRWGWLVLS